MIEVLIRIFTSTDSVDDTCGARLKTQLRKVVPELCVNDVPERAAEVGMSSANPVRDGSVA